MLNAGPRHMLRKNTSPDLVVGDRAPGTREQADGKGSSMKWTMFGLGVVCAFVSGCTMPIQLDLEPPAEAMTPICENATRDIYDETDVDCGGTCSPCQVGASCISDADCASGRCIPSEVHSEGTSGRCWDDTYSGCSLVDYEPEIVQAVCASRVLVVCQLALNSEMKKHCSRPSPPTSEWNTNFMCCDASIF